MHTLGYKIEPPRPSPCLAFADSWRKQKGRTALQKTAYHTLEQLAVQHGLTPPHFVLYLPSKAPKRKGWRKTRETADQAARHETAGGLVALIPQSLNLLVVDVDQGGKDAAAAVTGLLGTPLAEIPSKREGGYHLWYKAPTEAKRTRYQWEIEGVGAGEVLYNTRAAILWHPDLVVDAFNGYGEASPVDVSPLPVRRNQAKGQNPPVGTRNDTLFRKGLALTRENDRQAAIAEAEKWGLETTEALQTLASAEQAARTPHHALEDEPQVGEGIYYHPDARGLKAALAAATLELVRNIRTAGILIRRIDHDTDGAARFYSVTLDSADKPPDGWLPLDDYTDARLQTWIAWTYKNLQDKPLEYSEQRWRRSLRSLAWDKAYDPVKEWLQSLPAWDEKERLDTLFINALGAENTELNRAMAKNLLIAAVRRTYAPAGVKHELVPVTVGPQGVGKSTFCRCLLPPERQRGSMSWFSDSANLNDTTQKQVEGVQDALIVEYSELSRVSEAKLEATKNFISRESDMYRPPWFRQSVSIVRRWVCIATANGDGTGILPPDPTGNRRWVVIPVGNVRPQDVMNYLNENRDQLWAEAIHRHKAGEPHFLPPHLEKEQEQVNKMFTPRNEAIDNRVADLSITYAGAPPQQLSDLLKESKLARDDAEAADIQKQRDLARALKAARWTRKQVSMGGGKKQWRWQPPEITTLTCQGCKDEKPLAEFSERQQERKQPYCKDCEEAPPSGGHSCADGCGTRVDGPDQRCKPCARAAVPRPHFDAATAEISRYQNEISTITGEGDAVMAMAAKDWDETAKLFPPGTVPTTKDQTARLENVIAGLDAFRNADPDAICPGWSADNARLLAWQLATYMGNNPQVDWGAYGWPQILYDAQRHVITAVTQAVEQAPLAVRPPQEWTVMDGLKAAIEQAFGSTVMDGLKALQPKQPRLADA